MRCPVNGRVELLITLYQEVKDRFRSNSRCDDENERVGGNTSLPEQHFSSQSNKQKSSDGYCSFHICITASIVGQ